MNGKLKRHLGEEGLMCVTELQNSKCVVIKKLM